MKLLSAWVFFQGVVLVSTVLATVVMFASRGLPEGDWQADAGVLLEEGVVVLAEIGQSFLPSSLYVKPDKSFQN